MELSQLAPGVYAWFGATLGYGHANAGAVIDSDGVTLVDTLMVPSQYEPFGDAVDALGHRIRRVVMTSHHIPFVGGSGRFWQAAFYGSETTSEALELPPNVAGYRALMPDLADELGDELGTRPVSHTISQPAWLTAAIQVVPAPGVTRENVFVVVPGAEVCFAGALCSFGVTPLGFEADFDGWITTLGQVAAAAPTIVPGHGPAGGEAEVRALQAYLRACIDADGSMSGLASGPWDEWTNPEFHPVNVERAAQCARGDLDAVPASMLRLIGL